MMATDADLASRTREAIRWQAVDNRGCQKLLAVTLAVTGKTRMIE